MFTVILSRKVVLQIHCDVENKVGANGKFNAVRACPLDSYGSLCACEDVDLKKVYHGIIGF